MRDEMHWPHTHGTLCEMFNTCVDWLYEEWAEHLVHELCVDAILPKCPEFAEHVVAKGGVGSLTNVWGFIDGTIREISRLTEGQREVYNGWKRLHGLKYQSITTPDGILRECWGPMLARRHDAHMLYESGLLDVLDDNFNDAANKRPWALYGDPAYPETPWLMVGFRVRHEAAFNKRMNKCRVSVEWRFRKVIANWAYADFVKKQKLLECPTGSARQLASRSCAIDQLSHLLLWV
ncbi:unnamed protein product [Chrysoparadoxa australica]